MGTFFETQCILSFCYILVCDSSVHEQYQPCIWPNSYGVSAEQLSQLVQM